VLPRLSLDLPPVSTDNRIGLYDADAGEVRNRIDFDVKHAPEFYKNLKTSKVHTCEILYAVLCTIDVSSPINVSLQVHVLWYHTLCLDYTSSSASHTTTTTTTSSSG